MVSMLFLSGEGFGFVIRGAVDAGGKILRELWSFTARVVRVRFVKQFWSQGAWVLPNKKRRLMPAFFIQAVQQSATIAAPFIF
jgi:hypothetical protein